MSIVLSTLTGSCRPFQRSAQKCYELDTESELFVAVVCQRLSWYSVSCVLV